MSILQHSYITVGDLIGCDYCAVKHNGLWCHILLSMVDALVEVIWNLKE